jgi:hypothetical protein
VEEIIVAIPTRYSETLAPQVRALADAVERADSTRRQRAELVEASTSMRYPKWMEGAIGSPPFQPMAAFAASAVGSAAVEQHTSDVAISRRRAMDSWILSTAAVLDSQYRFFLDRCGSGPEDEMTASVKARTAELCKLFPVMVENPDYDARATGNRTPEPPTIPGVDATAARYRAEETRTLDAVQSIAEAVRSVVTSRHVRRAALDAKKAALKAQAEDVEMRAPDASGAGSSTGATGLDAAAIRRIIREEVAASSVSRHPSQFNSLIDSWMAETEEGPAAAAQEEGVGEEGPAPAWTEEERSGWESQRERARRVMCDGAWNYDTPSSYPNILCTLSPLLACKIIAWRAPPAVREALRFRHAIHIQEGLEPPSDILRDLGAGMRYIMPITVKPALPLEAWNDFTRRFRWFFYFTENPPTVTGELPFEPAFVSPVRVSSRRAPEAPPAIESGLEVGRALMASWHGTAPTSTDDWQRRLAPDFRGRIQEWVMTSEVVVTQTDKNLGLALIRKEWFIRETRTLLRSEQDYQQLTLRSCLSKMQDSVAEYAIQLSDWEQSTSLCANKQLHDFLVAGVQRFLGTDGLPRPINQFLDDFEQSCLDAGVEPALLPDTPIMAGLEMYRAATPQFYGLPKIHKDPWRMRPIFPCHSAIVAHPAKVLSLLLKQLIAECPYVLEGTKAFCMDLRKVALNSFEVADEKIFIVTADIVAYYPNVPVGDAADCVRLQWQEFCRNHPVPKVYMELFEGLLVLNTQLPSVCQFMEEYFMQRRGLAMGMHCAPDLANLYAAFHEEDFVSSRQNILFYRRFIDDLFFLVRAASAESALELCKEFSLPGCELSWSAALQSAVFLDVFVWLSPMRGIQWKPYRKPLNHQERIPWISAHPLTVKRGTFLGEMSRLAILSSTETIFREAIADLARLYLSRGYPNKVLQSWLKDQHKRWVRRYAPRDAGEDPLVLKSEMNPVWNLFPIRQLADAVRAEWTRLPAFGLKRSREQSPDPPVRRRRLRVGFTAAPPADEVFPLPALGTERENADDEALSEEQDRAIRTNTRALVDRRFLLSKKRTRNVGDLFNTWKKQLVYAVISDQQQDSLWPEVTLDE